MTPASGSHHHPLACYITAPTRIYKLWMQSMLSTSPSSYSLYHHSFPHCHLSCSEFEYVDAPLRSTGTFCTYCLSIEARLLAPRVALIMWCCPKQMSHRNSVSYVSSYQELGSIMGRYKVVPARGSVKPSNLLGIPVAVSEVYQSSNNQVLTRGSLCLPSAARSSISLTHPAEITPHGW
jgi:hypothetical protein